MLLKFLTQQKMSRYYYGVKARNGYVNGAIIPQYLRF